MSFQNIIPTGNDWKLQKNRLFYKKLAWIPVCDFKENHIEIFLNISIANCIFKILKPIIHNSYKHYFISPIYSNPQRRNYDENHKNYQNVINMFDSYSKPVFFDHFNNIGYDFIKNVISYTTDHNCYELTKEAYEQINNKVQEKAQDFATWEYYYPYREDIRSTYNSLYRDIQINKILYYS